MSNRTSIRCYDYVNRPYDQVCTALLSKSNSVFHEATKSAETRAEHVAAGLHVKIAGVEIGKEILVRINSYTDIENRDKQELIVNLEWSASESPHLFPTMNAQLSVYPITGTETQLDFRGEYEPPLGVIGKAVDALVGHRIAEASVHHFMSEVAEYLRTHIDS